MRLSDAPTGEVVDFLANGAPATFNTTSGSANLIVITPEGTHTRLIKGDTVFVSSNVAGLLVSIPYYVISSYYAGTSTFAGVIMSHSAVNLREAATLLNPSPSTFYANATTESVASLLFARPGEYGNYVDFELDGTTPVYFATISGTNVVHLDTPNLVASKLKVNDRVYVTYSQGGLAAATTYWVVYSSFLGTTLGHDLKLSLKRGGLPVTLNSVSVAGQALRLVGPLNELSGAAAHPTTGDWRKIIAGTMDGMYQKWSNLEEADRPRRLSMTRANGVTGNFSSLTYTVKLTLAAQGVDAIAHE
jgi:hypothetical protein